MHNENGEVTYKAGQWFLVDGSLVGGSKCLLAQVGYAEMALICIDSVTLGNGQKFITANRWTEPVRVNNVTAVTEPELRQMMGSQMNDPIQILKNVTIKF